METSVGGQLANTGGPLTSEHKQLAPLLRRLSTHRTERTKKALEAIVASVEATLAAIRRHSEPSVVVACMLSTMHALGQMHSSHKDVGSIAERIGTQLNTELWRNFNVTRV